MKSPKIRVKRVVTGPINL